MTTHSSSTRATLSRVSLRLGATATAALASALLLWISGPAVGAGLLAWVALVPVGVAALRSQGTRVGRLAVPLAYVLYLELLLVPALPFGIAYRQWGDPVLPVMVADSPIVFVAVIAVPFAGLLLYAVRFPQPVALERASPFVAGVGGVLVPAVAWTALDVVRTKFDPGGLWGPLFLSQHDTPVAGLAALAGPWLLTFAVVAVAYTVALGLVRRRAAVAVGLPVVMIALALAASKLLADAPGDRSPRLTVAAVQPGYDTAEFERPVLHYLRAETRDVERASVDLVRNLEPLSQEAARRGATVAVWPEATVWVDPRENERVRNELVRIAREDGLVLVVPYFLRPLGQGATVVVLPDGTVSDDQPKQRPMWFLGENGGNRVRPQPVPTGAGAVGTLLGVDNQDPGRARALAASGAVVVSSSTHDWAQLAPEQRAFAQLHAAALRVPLVRADWRYGSVVFDAGGRRVADAGGGKRRVALVATVAPRARRTPYARVGDAFGWACLAALAPLSLAGWRSRRIRRRASGGSALPARAARG